MALVGIFISDQPHMVIITSVTPDCVEVRDCLHGMLAAFFVVAITK